MENVYLHGSRRVADRDLRDETAIAGSGREELVDGSEAAKQANVMNIKSEHRALNMRKCSDPTRSLTLVVP